MSRTARLGAFILVTLAILATGIFIIGSKKFLFSSTYDLKTSFGNVAGLEVGADVMVGGVQSGTVKSIELPNNSKQQILVRLELNKNTQKIIKQDSVASIQTEGLLGNQYVAISFGSEDKPEVKSGDTIASVPPLEMAALLDKANGILASGQVAMANLTAVTDNLKSVSAKVNNGSGTVGALINDRSLYNNINETSAKLNDTASSAKGAVVSAQAGITDFQENMEALKHNFLLKGYFKNRGYEDSSELGKDEIVSAPQGTPMKEFTLQAKDLFDKQDSAKLKGQKQLKDAGEYLANNEFGVAVISVSTGKSGDAKDSITLAQGRALVLHDFIVQHYGFDDTKLKTIAIGKQADEQSKSDWGLIKITIYPTGTAIPADKNADQTAAPAAAPAAAQPATAPAPKQ